MILTILILLGIGLAVYTCILHSIGPILGILLAVGYTLGCIIVFLLLPIYTANFDPASYGDNDLSMTTVTMLASLLFMEVWTPLLRFW